VRGGGRHPKIRRPDLPARLDYFFAAACFGSTSWTSSCGRGITCTLTTSPTVRAAWAPASVAALTAATSPMTTAGHESVADLFHRAGECDVRRLEHGVSTGDKAVSPGFEQTNGVGTWNDGSWRLC